MIRTFFGTDGIRGQANRFPMTAEIAMRVGMAAGTYFVRGSHRHRVIIGKDTRLSGYMIEPALVSGFISVGMDVILVGPMPTPAIAKLTRSLRADLGVMISASHNTYQDNGIKLFGPNGLKLSDEVELAIEDLMQNPNQITLAAPNKLGRAKRLEDEVGRYIENVKQTFPNKIKFTLDGLKIVLDCANGAAYQAAPKALWELGAEVIPVAVNPNGFNINEKCGSTYPELISEEVRKNGAHVGIALDGDADRVVMCDEHGTIIDGDQLLAVIATHQLNQGTLKGGGVVATQMSNLGLERYLSTLGLHLIRTQVGDRYVVETMREKGYNVGGEQSGHIILTDYTTTGDGLIAALQVLAVMVQQEKPASEVTNLFKPVPQLLKNVRYKDGQNPLESTSVQAVIKKFEKKLAKTGRIFIRKSGTEPLIRVMAEGEDQTFIEEAVNAIVAEVEAATR
ncbi:MAG: phosphoglucosamine mutase [Rickettsiales bacterium]|jgi:phosphoglucosamine mutase|nr:phosphoglucosamine mutase [Rickettsiales bacterium]